MQVALDMVRGYILLGHSSAPCHILRSLGTLVISLQQLQSTGHLVLQEALVEENLRVSPVSLPVLRLPSSSLRVLLDREFHFSERKIQIPTGVVTRPPSQGSFHCSP